MQTPTTTSDEADEILIQPEVAGFVASTGLVMDRSDETYRSTRNQIALIRV